MNERTKKKSNNANGANTNRLKSHGKSKGKFLLAFPAEILMSATRISVVVKELPLKLKTAKAIIDLFSSLLMLLLLLLLPFQRCCFCRFTLCRTLLD